MKANELRSVIISSREWRDKTYGNTYYAARVMLNFGMDNAEEFYMDFRYGYGNQAEYDAIREIAKQLNVNFDGFNTFKNIYNNFGYYIKVDTQITQNCKKKDLKKWF